MVELATILVGVVVPLIIGPLSVFCKSLWDRYSKTKELKQRNRYDKKMKQLDDKINIFYWPVYLKLKTLDRISYELKKDLNLSTDFTLDMGSLMDTTLSEHTEYSSDGQDMVIKRRKKKKMKCIRDGCEQINHNPNLSLICYKCRMLERGNSSPLHRSKSLSKFDETNIILGNMGMDSDIEEGDKFNNSYEIQDPQQIDLNYSPDQVNLSFSQIDRKQSMKKIEVHDDLQMQEHNLLVTVDKFFLLELDKKILKIINEIKDLIECNISIIQPSKSLVKEMIKFTRYGEMLEIVYKSNVERKKKYNIEDLGVKNNTKRLISLIKIDLDKYMNEYQDTFDSYNNVSNQKCCSRK